VISPGVFSWAGQEREAFFGNLAQDRLRVLSGAKDEGGGKGLDPVVLHGSSVTPVVEAVFRDAVSLGESEDVIPGVLHADEDEVEFPNMGKEQGDFPTARRAPRGEEVDSDGAGKVLQGDFIPPWGVHRRGSRAYQRKRVKNVA
jgi:radical SAM superfamily enzyme YgiQ (UPF0313 family)